MPDTAAAIGLHQLAKVEAFRVARESIARRYNAAFSSLPVQLPAGPVAGDIHSWHLYPLRLNLDELLFDRSTFIERLRDLGIGSSVHFIPLHMHPYWKDTYRLELKDFPVATREYEREVSLPIYPAMTDADVDRVIDAVGCILSER